MTNTKILDDSDMLFQSWEPKVKNRFLVEWKGIPSSLIKSINIRLEKDNNRVFFKIYDPTVMSPMDAIIKKCMLNYEQNLIFKMLGPVGDIIESYELKIKNIKAEIDYDWAKGDLSILNVEADILDIQQIDEIKPLSTEEKQKIVETLAPNLFSKKLDKAKNKPFQKLDKKVKDTTDLAKSQINSLNKKLNKK